MSAVGRVLWGALMMGPGTQYAVSGVTGLDDMPEVRAYDVDKTGAHGTWTGPDYTGARIITVDLVLRGTDPANLGALVAALKQAAQPGQAPAQLQFPDLGVMALAKIRKRDLPYDATVLWRTGGAHLQFYCADPLIYSIAQRTARTAAYAPATGRAYPRAYPWLYGSGGASGGLQCTNAGASPTYPQLRIDGPAVQPIIQLSETSAILQLNNTVGPGQFVTIDTGTRAVLDGGTTPRRDWVVPGSDWPVMQPGANTFVYRSSPYGDGSQQSYLTVTWRDATL
ncbi:phage distal tail protein [Saccharothrix sp. ST-888]|uniref:phage distal tail protein n=1 Tax=Saccharothrix sp. ST-888 TaxID=1427391 RepID=UPI0005ED262E|nr:phage tail domain-containing protein [Saccharothrix sp. ST-888]KJK55648.1 hypothetical protein UK12_27395 [Saccharothrix sp. ST-888]